METEIKDTHIHIRQLPDTHNPEVISSLNLMDYGRCWITNSGLFGWGGIRSSHPRNTRTGWYWGVDNYGDLIISPRNVVSDTDILFQNNNRIIGELISELKKNRILPRHSERDSKETKDD